MWKHLVNSEKLYNANTITNWHLNLPSLFCVSKNFQMQKSYTNSPITNTMLFSVLPMPQRQRRENPSSIRPRFIHLAIVAWNHRWRGPSARSPAPPPAAASYSRCCSQHSAWTEVSISLILNFQYPVPLPEILIFLQVFRKMFESSGSGDMEDFLQCIGF